MCCLLVLASGLLFPGTAVAGVFVENIDDSTDPDGIVLDVHVSDDGTASWTIEHRYRLATSDDEAAFDELSADIGSNESTYIDRFTEQMSGTVDNAEASTNREMAIENVSIDTETRALPREYGIVRYTFDWHGFGSLQNDQVHVGDAIAGMFLDDGTTLRLTWEEEYELVDSDPTPSQSDDQSIRWDGPADFNDDEPMVILEAESGIPGLLTSLGLLILGFVVIMGLGGWWFLAARGSGTDEVPSETPGEEDALLSNEERVLQLIEEEGGRLKQQAVVNQLGWTDAKTSQVITELRESGDVESFRLGRENVLRLPDSEDNTEV